MGGHGTTYLANGTMKDEPRPIHEHDHATPTVIHHPEEDMTILARWLHRGMEQGPKFWLLVIGSAVALLAVASLLGGLTMGSSSNGQAWVDLIPAKTAEEQLKVAEAHPKTPVADWARLQAAFEEYRNGLEALTDPKQRDLLARPRLDKALELFRRVAEDAPKPSPQARGAAFGVARALEARNDLAEAIKQYRYVAETWRDSPEARQSLVMARALEDPENVAFYKELYAYKAPAAATSPGSAIPETPAPGKIPGVSADLFGPGPARKTFLPDPKDLRDLAPPPTAPEAPAKSSEAPRPDSPKGELPIDPFNPPK